MGSRAHYVTKSGGEWELRYSHWGASTIDRDVFWGPDHTRRFIAAQAISDGWMDEVWCEGAILVDDDRRLLLFFGGDHSTLVAHRRALEAMMRTTWPGWDIRRAPEGIGDIAAALGVDRRQVRTDLHCEPVDAGWESWTPPPDSLPMAVVTLAREGRVDAFVVDALLPDLVAAGPDRLLAAAGPATALVVDDLPVGGLHVDGDRRALHLWMAESMRLDELATSPWSGWTIERLGDDFEAHAELAAGALTFRPPPRDEVLAELREYLLAENDTDPADLRARLTAEVGPVRFAPEFDAHVVLRPSAAERRAIVERAIASLG